METTPPRRPTLTTIFSDSEKIITTNYTHFIILSLFFLPLSLYLITTPVIDISVQQLTTNTFPHKLWTNMMNLDQNHHNSVICYIVCIIFVYLLTMFAISMITYTTHHGFSGKPVNFFTTVKSVTSIFFPIVTTAITAHCLIFLFLLSFLLFVQTNLMLPQNLGFVIDYNSSNFIWFSYIIGTVLIAILTYFLLNWSLAFVVVVVELKSGISALRKSSDLMMGMRSVSLVMFLYFGFLFGISIWVPSDSIHALCGSGYVWFAIVLGSGLLIFYMMHCTVATTVLYNYCKNFHGESVINGFGHDYADLGFDYEKVKVPNRVVEC